jgi:hypothetical protein
MAWITIERIRPDVCQEHPACQDVQDLLDARDEDGQGRLLVPLIEARLDVLVHTPEDIRTHMVV